MFEPLTRKFIAWHHRRMAIRRLERLDDRLLADMGTKRDEISCFVASLDC